MPLTIKQQKLQEYNEIILANKAKFTPGKTITRKQLVKMFKIPGINHKGAYPKVHRSNLALLNVQMDINVLLRENGLYLQSKDYYTKFVIAEKLATKKTIVRYSAEVDVNRRCAVRLEARMKSRVQAKSWGTYQDVPDNDIASLNNPQTVRHAKTIQRVKSF